MSQPLICAGILLAAGASRRFGSENKLLASFQGRPLVCHAADALRRTGLDHLVAVVRDQSVKDLLSDFQTVKPDVADPAQSDSLRAGVSAAQALNADRLVVVLGDMPFVTSNMISTVADACTNAVPSAMSGEKGPLPPACFPSAFFDDLLRLTGDRGAASFLKDATLIAAPPDALKDVDTPQALQDLRQNSTTHLSQN